MVPWDSAVDEVFLNLQALKVFCFPRPHSDLHEVMYSNQDKMKRYRFMKHEQVLSDEECARIRFNLLTDDCMKLIEEELTLFNNLSAHSASWHDKDSLSDSFNYNACFSDTLDWQDKMPRVLSQSGRVLSQSGARDEDCKLSFSFASV